MKRLTQTIRAFLHILLPERADAALVKTLVSDELRQLVTVRQYGTTTTLLPFRDARVRACIHEVKYHKNLQAAALLADILSTYIGKNGDVHNICIIPVPLSPERLRERGYNQVALVAKLAAKNPDIVCRENILIRVRNTQPQTSLSRTERLQNVRDAFALANEAEAKKTLSGVHVIVLDDVTTTGATLTAARAPLVPLHSHIASLTCLALAH